MYMFIAHIYTHIAHTYTLIAHMGRTTNITLDVWGGLNRGGKRCWFHKLNANGQHRPGPANMEEALAPTIKHVRPGGWVCSDGLPAYKILDTLGYRHLSVAHSKGEFVKKKARIVHTNGIDGEWSDLKNGIRGKKGLLKHRVEDGVYEHMWRHNLRIDHIHPMDSVLRLLSKSL